MKGLIRGITCALCIALTACAGTYYEQYLAENPGWLPNLPAAGIGLEETVAALYAPFEGRSQVSVRRLGILRIDVEPWQPLQPGGLRSGAWTPSSAADYAVVAHFACSEHDGLEFITYEAIGWYLLPGNRLTAWRHPDWLEDFPCGAAIGFHVAEGDLIPVERRLRVWVAASCAALADAYQVAGELDAAERYLARAAAIAEKLPDDPPLAADLLELHGLLLLERGDPRAAHAAFMDLLKLRRIEWSHDSGSLATLPLVAMADIALGDLGSARRRVDEALHLAERYAEASEFNGHFMFAQRALLADLDGDLDGALGWQRRAVEAMEDRRAFSFLVGDELERRAAAASFSPYVEYAVDLALRSGSRSGARVAMEALLASKGRVLDAVLGERVELRGDLDPASQAAAQRVAEVRSRLDELAEAGPGSVPPQTLKVAFETFQEATRSLQSSLMTGTQREQRRLLDRVAAALPAESALVEFALYRAFDRDAATHSLRAVQAGPFRYAACVLRPDRSVGCADLGSVAEVDREVTALRRSLSSPLKSDVRTRGRVVYQRLLEPLAVSLAGARELVIAAEGTLNLVPFAVVVADDDRFLVESSRIWYLTSGRDLLRARTASSGTPAVFIGDPDFDAEVVSSGGAAGPRPSPTSAAARFPRLPGTAKEVRDLAGRVPGARTLTRAAATEQAVKALQRPTILHLATHGFFLPDDATSEPALHTPLIGARPLGDVALLRSGLALAGANRGSRGGEDGILTALELSRLDLAGTQLVVLSACETGLGDVAAGEGVYGLRRAVLLAGAEAQLTSLWKVNDDATQELMSRYYMRLARNEAPVDALREVQLEMKADPLLAHPYYWAGFIPIGRSGPVRWGER